MKLISIHIPKTAGTSFYHILQQVYGPELSISFKRRDINPLLEKGQLKASGLSPTIQVIHGHFNYIEVAELHQKSNAKLICWLRDPIERLLSNYIFFKAGLLNPARNPVQYEKNKHRINETILEYAQMTENQNRMHSFLEGLSINDLFFCGFMSNFTTDLARLAHLLGWPSYEIKHLNKGARKQTGISPELRQLLEGLNQKDVELYQQLRAQFIQHEE